MLAEFWQDYGQLLAQGTGTTLYMTLASTLMAYVLGIPMGIILVVTAPGGLRPNAVIYKIMDFAVNIVRSVPFLILLIMIMPFTRLDTSPLKHCFSFLKEHCPYLLLF